MTEAEETELLAAMKPVPMIMLQCGSGPSQQERANAAWESLGKKRGFDHMTVSPRYGLSQRHFTAVPSETEIQRAERELKERSEKRAAEILQLQKEIADRSARLAELNSITQ